ncbi:class I adenylate-forming enzyme family protein [Brevundimonas sp. GCM10030266]|uniref:class I adenylate-forming enzyme family protein n=1 Tax=Brevundimonas sp. GCM10030266 TaxID=3273386 RepID=UPI00361B997E
MIVIPEHRIREMKARGWWGDVTLDDLFRKHVAAHPDTEALIDPFNAADITGGTPERLTWAQSADAVDRLAAVLHAHGLGKDDVVVVQLPNIAQLSIVYLACLRLGIIISPAPVQYREHELGYIIGKTDAVAVITAERIGKQKHGEMLVAMKPACPTLRHVFVLGEACPDGALNLEALTDAATPADRAVAEVAARAAQVTADDIVTICWTSGTEAQPKGVPRSHNEWLIMGHGVIDAADLEPGASLLNPFPMVNMGGISTAFIGWLLLGGALIQHHPFDLQVLLKQMRDEKIDYTVAPPAVLNLLLQNEAMLEGIDFKRLKSIGSGSAPLSEWMVRGFHEKYGVQIVNYFGSNEGASFPSALKDLPEAADRASLFPRLGEGFEWNCVLHDRIFTRLVDPETEEEITEGGRPGELRVKGATIFSGYWRAPEINQRAFDADGWFRTGDLFELAGDRLQYLKFVGRLKDIIIRGGMNISSEEIESHLVAHPAIAEAAVVGAPDPNLGERLLAFVVFRPDQSASMAEINAFLTGDRHVAVYKQIERLETLEALPRNPVGKILKRELRQSVANETQPA